MKKLRWILSIVMVAVLLTGNVPIAGLASGGGTELQLPVQLLEADEDGDGSAAVKGFSTLTEALTYVKEGRVIPSAEGVLHLNVTDDIQDKGYVCDLSGDTRIRKLVIRGDGSDGRAVRVDTAQTTAPKDGNKAVEFDIVLASGGQLEIANLIFPHNMVFDAVYDRSDHTKKVYVHDCTFYGTWNPVKACVSGEYRFEDNSWKDFQGYCVWIKTEGSKDISYDFVFNNNDVRRYRVFNSATDNKAADCGIVNVTMLDNSFVHEREYTQETGSCMALCQISGWINGKIDVERNTMIGYYSHKNCVPALVVQANPYTSGIKSGSEFVIKDNLRQCDVVEFSYQSSFGDKTDELVDHNNLSSVVGEYKALLENNSLVHMYPESSSPHDVEDHCHICNICEQAVVNITTDGHGVIIDKSLLTSAGSKADTFSNQEQSGESDKSGGADSLSEKGNTESITVSSSISTTGAGEIRSKGVRKNMRDTGGKAMEAVSISLPQKAAGSDLFSAADSECEEAGFSGKNSSIEPAGAAEGKRTSETAGICTKDISYQTTEVSEGKSGGDTVQISDADTILRTFSANADESTLSPASVFGEAEVSGKVSVIAYNYQDSVKNYVPGIKRTGVVIDVDKEKTFTAIPDPGYELADFLVDGESVKEELDQDEDGDYCWTFCNYGGLERCPEIYASFRKTYSAELEADTIVLDYGLAVALTDMQADWSIYSNDHLADCRVTGVTFDASRLKYGVLAEQEGIYYYKPTRIMQEQEQLRYTVTQLEVNGRTVSLPESEQETEEITIVPASIVFYEPDVLADKKSDITVNAKKIQDVADDEIGFDAVYAATSDNGKSVEIAFDEQQTADRNSGFRFTFTGIGADIIGVTNTESGKLVYYVTDKTGTAVQVGVVDSYYSANGTEGIDHVPVIGIRMEKRGTYTVTVNIHESGATSHKQSREAVQADIPAGVGYENTPSGKAGSAPADEFILQGIRIYSTMTNEQYYELDSDHYLQETAEIRNVRELLENTHAAILSSYEEEGLESYGVTIVENIENTTIDLTNELTDYLSRGPGNEVYLGEHMAYAFVAEIQDTSKDYVLSVEARTIGIGDGGESETIRIALDDQNGRSKEIAEPGIVAMYYAIDLKSCIPLGGQKYLVVIEGAGNDEEAISLSNLKVNNLQISCPYLDANAMEWIHTATDEAVCRIAIQKVELITSTVTRSKRVEYNVTLDPSDLTDETVINIYCNGKRIGTVETKDAGNLNTSKSSDNSCVYVAAFKAPSTKGSYKLSFYANDGTTDSICCCETVLKVR